MKKIIIGILVLILAGCSTPIAKEDVDTPEKALILVIKDFRAIVGTANAMRDAGIIVADSPLFHKLGGAMVKAWDLIEDSKRALGIRDMVQVEMNITKIKRIVLQLRSYLKEVDNEQTSSSVEGSGYSLVWDGAY